MERREGGLWDPAPVCISVSHSPASARPPWPLSSTVRAAVTQPPRTQSQVRIHFQSSSGAGEVSAGLGSVLPSSKVASGGSLLPVSAGEKPGPLCVFWNSFKQDCSLASCLCAARTWGPSALELTDWWSRDYLFFHRSGNRWHLSSCGPGLY